MVFSTTCSTGEKDSVLNWVKESDIQMLFGEQKGQDCHMYTPGAAGEGHNS